MNTENINFNITIKKDNGSIITTIPLNFLDRIKIEIVNQKKGHIKTFEKSILDIWQNLSKNVEDSFDNFDKQLQNLYSKSLV